MALDKNKFFRRFTLEICSSLNINIALKRGLDYLAEVFPVREISLNIMDKKLGAIRVVARAIISNAPLEQPPSSPKNANGQFGCEVLPLPEAFWHWCLDNIPQDPVIFNDEIMAKVPPEFADLLPHADNPESEIVIPLQLEGVRIGACILFAPDGLSYQPEHLELIASVKDPLAVALANAITYQELIYYRDTLIDDKMFLQEELIASDQIIGEHGGLKDVITLVDQVAGLNNTVLILGDTGVGKEIIANAIHQRSNRKNGPFIKVNCGAIADSLIDSELFGYEKGAFTGAVAQRRGRFERADGGTIFLDEVGELSLNAQVRLLRVLANREIERVGGNKVIPVDLRIITATHRNLSQLVSENKFREDLWFRLNGFPIYVPPLRQRIEDIPLLAKHFINIKCRELGISQASIAPGGLERLMRYDWPGNVRELENVIERELIRHPYGALQFESIITSSSKNSVPDSNRNLQALRSDHHLSSLDEAMRTHILLALQKADGKINGPDGAAEILKIHPNTLRSRMDKLGISYRQKK